MLRHREDAADAVADSFVIFAERLPQLRDPNRLRPWLYAIVRSKCLRQLKARKRVAYGDEEQLVTLADDALTPQEHAERAALQQLVWDASAGLADRDRALLDLHLRQGLEDAELGEAMGVTSSNAYVMLNRLRAQVDRSLGALLMARIGRDDCEELDAVLADWDGGFSPLVRKRVARHVDGCDVCSERRRTMVSPWALLAGVPLFAPPLGLRDRVLGDTELVTYGGGAYEEIAGGAVGARRWSAGRTTLAAAALLALIVLSSVLFWPEADQAVAPVDATPTAEVTPAPTTASQSPTPTAAAPTVAPPTPAPTVTPSETATQVPGSLIVSTRGINLGTTGTQARFLLTNIGDLPVTYQVSPRVPWLSLRAIGGKLAGGRGTETILQADRAAVREGVSTGRVVITWNGGSLTVRVTLDEERLPVVGQPTVPANQSCDVDVSATVTDESGVDSAVLAWTGPSASGRTEMRRPQTGSTWTAQLNVAVGGSFTMQVDAKDSRGNAATGPSSTVVLDPCRQ
jgi:RNA polymerase sigma factor (sigma-70 family)